MKRFVNITENILKTSTFKQSGVTLFGTLLNGLIGVVFYIYVARLLGPHDYGVFSFVTITVALLASIANVGTDTGVTKFAAESWSKDKKRAIRFLNAGFLIKLTGFTIVLAGGFLLTSFITEFLLSKQGLNDAFRWALLGVGGSMLFSFGCAALQSLQKFWGWSFVNVAGNTFRFLVFLLVISVGFPAGNAAILLFVLSPFIGFVLSILMIPRFMGVPLRKSELSELFHFNKWVAATTIIVAVSTRLDTLYSTRFLTLEEVGYYSVAVSLVGFISQIVLALGTVAAPKFAMFTKLQDAKRYLYKFELFVGGLIVIGIPVGVLVANTLVPLLYGEEYRPSIIPLIILIVGYALFLLSMPIHTMILYFLGKSRFFFWLAIVHVITIAIAGFFLIPEYKIIGAAMTAFLGMCVNLIIPAIFVLRYKK